jgi:hypothetical protein
LGWVYLFLADAVGLTVKILLKQIRTGQFVRDWEHWTDIPEDAFDFKTTPTAMDYAQIHGFHGLSILLKFPDSRLDVELRNCC